MEFGFETSPRILFGSGRIAAAPELALGFGRRILLVTGSDPERWNLAANLNSRGAQPTVFPISSEPSVDLIQEGIRQARSEGCDAVIAIGGGSVLDGGKAIAALAPNPGEILDYLEVVGKGRPLQKPSLPCLAIPTTAGTGSEVTRNAVLGVPGHGVKVSLRHSSMIPKVALIDPDLTATVPIPVRAASGLDAVTQVLEAFVSRKRNVLVDGLCRQALRLAGRSFLRTCGEPDDPEDRESMCFVSLVGGMALTNAGLGAVHGLAGPLGGMLQAPHGALCARLVGPVTAANIRELAVTGDPEGLLPRFDEMGALLYGEPDTNRHDLVHWLEDAATTTGIPPLDRWGFARGMIPETILKAGAASSMKGNPVQLAPAVLREILEQSC